MALDTGVFHLRWGCPFFWGGVTDRVSPVVLCMDGRGTFFSAEIEREFFFWSRWGFLFFVAFGWMGGMGMFMSDDMMWGFFFFFFGHLVGGWRLGGGERGLRGLVVHKSSGE